MEDGEENLVRRLRRLSFEDLQEAMTILYSSDVKFEPNAHDVILLKCGWTRDEYVAERHHRLDMLAERYGG